ncbi:MAG: hypothetical protein D6722_04645 [Bacteroidetes bacterium]|nr:MAG: hypothetical protein D6722_04645 [Bacteroidota bacterium]
MEVLFILLMWLSGFHAPGITSTAAPSSGASFMPSGVHSAQTQEPQGNESLRVQRLVQGHLLTRTLVIFEDTHFRVSGQ